MNNYKKIIEDALKRARVNGLIKEEVLYPEKLAERMHPFLEKDIAERKHSLGKHPIFPEYDDATFEEKILGERFSEVAKRYKRAFDVETIDTTSVMLESMGLIKNTLMMEAKHKKALIELAIKMVREEFDMGEDVVEINANLVNRITLEGTIKNPKPIELQLEFDRYDDITNAAEEVKKRRFINAMIQGAAKKCNHMFHLVEDELTDLNPKLPNQYSKLMSNADYMYFVIPNMDDGIAGGKVHVQFPSEKNPKAIITAEAMVFPVLIHELVKGVMELISAHGLPQDKKIGEYVINKSDYTSAEAWDMRLGPALWGKFTNLLEAEDFNLKHQIYMELVKLPVSEFNKTMREIMANTKDGKKIIENLGKQIKQELSEDELREVENKDKDTYSIDELLGEDDDSDSYDFDDLNI